ncbi:MAG: adenylate/guanylate cyclase domain-containing protein [Azonexus sp.]|jgi:class 3 adenylate cyclase|nr:adenylate/guanylate cyclase domain-containing protein [Azonexus sp.]
MSTTKRKKIIMFADVSGSTGLFERLGDDEAKHAVERCLKRMQRSVDGFGGRTVQIEGDELLAVYPSAEEACNAAINMQQRVAELPPVSGLQLTIRIGLHTGPVTENGGKVSGETVTSTARIAGIARHDQILCSSALAAEVPAGGAITLRPMPELGTIPERGANLALFGIRWKTGEETRPPTSAASRQPPGKRLCLRYRGKTYLLDSKAPVLTLGRDPGNGLVIDDRMASRHHARIERRPDGYFLVDSSTNGCFVTQSNSQETLVRRQEIALAGGGRICFGGSANNANTDGVDFEHL